MEDKYIQILDFLSIHGIEQQIDIKPFILELFKNVRVVEVHGYLELMVLNGHIKFNYNSFDIYPDTLISSITLKGSDFLNSYLLKKATLQSFKSQRWYNYVTWFISVLAIIGTIAMGIYSTTQNKDLSQRIDYLNQQLLLLKKQQQKQVVPHRRIDTVAKISR